VVTSITSQDFHSRCDLQNPISPSPLISSFALPTKIIQTKNLWENSRQQSPDRSSFLRPLLREDLVVLDSVSSEFCTILESPRRCGVGADSLDQVVDINPDTLQSLSRITISSIFHFGSKGGKSYQSAFGDAGKIVIDSHVLAQPLPVLKLGLIAEISAEFGDDVLLVQTWKRGR
jgi:hypothetical protein